MHPDAMFIAALIFFPAIALVAWACIAMAQVEEKLRTLSGFERRDFEIGPQANRDTEGARWPIPG